MASFSKFLLTPQRWPGRLRRIMSGSGGSRGDEGGFGQSGSDVCGRSWQSPISSPKQDLLRGTQIDDILEVTIDNSESSRPVLVVQRAHQAVGSLTFRGYLQVIDCIMNHGVRYRAVVMRVSGGVYDVRIEVTP